MSANKIRTKFTRLSVVLNAAILANDSNQLRAAALRACYLADYLLKMSYSGRKITLCEEFDLFKNLTETRTKSTVEDKTSPDHNQPLPETSVSIVELPSETSDVNTSDDEDLASIGIIDPRSAPEIFKKSAAKLKSKGFESKIHWAAVESKYLYKLDPSVLGKHHERYVSDCDDISIFETVYHYVTGSKEPLYKFMARSIKNSDIETKIQQILYDVPQNRKLGVIKRILEHMDVFRKILDETIPCAPLLPPCDYVETLFEARLYRELSEIYGHRLYH